MFHVSACRAFSFVLLERFLDFLSCRLLELSIQKFKCLLYESNPIAFKGWEILKIGEPESFVVPRTASPQLCHRTSDGQILLSKGGLKSRLFEVFAAHHDTNSGRRIGWSRQHLRRYPYRRGGHSTNTISLVTNSTCCQCPLYFPRRIYSEVVRSGSTASEYMKQ